MPLSFMRLDATPALALGAIFTLHLVANPAFAHSAIPSSKIFWTVWVIPRVCIRKRENLKLAAST